MMNKKYILSTQVFFLFTVCLLSQLHADPENFAGSLAGDVTGKQKSTVVSLVGGVNAANVASGVNLANGATSSNIPNTLVKRNAFGNFAASTITANLNGNATTATTAGAAANFTGALSGDVVGTQENTVISTIAGTNATTIASGATAANAATHANVANSIVKRDANGNFLVNGVGLNEIVPFGSDTILINGDLALAPESVLYVDHIAGKASAAVHNMTVVDLTVLGNIDNPSDRRLKTDVTALDIERCLAAIKKITPREFSYDPAVRKAMNDDGGRHLGFIAQELAKIDSRFVHVVSGKQKIGDLTVEDLVLIRNELFIPLLVGALKAEMVEIQNLKDRVQELELRNARKKGVDELVDLEEIAKALEQ